MGRELRRLFNRKCTKRRIRSVYVGSSSNLMLKTDLSWYWSITYFTVPTPLGDFSLSSIKVTAAIIFKRLKSTQDSGYYPPPPKRYSANEHTENSIES
jgi:hypothetical protein